jgi:tRNA(adenine34) deaminase
MDADEVYMDEALQEARKAYTMGEVPIGAVLVDEAGQIIARAHWIIASAN